MADKVGQLGVQSVKETQNVFGLRCPLDAEYKVGNNWAERIRLHMLEKLLKFNNDSKWDIDLKFGQSHEKKTQNF